VNIIEDYPLKNLNTFGIEASARYFCSVSNISELTSIINDKKIEEVPVLILGGGSNLLFTSDYDGLIIKIDIKGVCVVNEEQKYVYIESGAGMIWHELVRHCVDQNYGGIENLSLIPGTVGAAPMQNIGAYGVEIKDVFHSLQAIHLNSGEVKTFYKEDCQFGYRDSIFKNRLKGQYAIVSVTLRLDKDPKPNLTYGSLKKSITEMGCTEDNVTIKEISDAVIKIRRSKLPNPSKIGNAGSFFKNPKIGGNRLNELQSAFNDIPFYPLGNNRFKVPAGWLIEQCGWKGKVIGNTGTYKNQALVLVNHGNATGKEIYNLSEKILKSVYEKFGIQLEREVNIV